MEAYTAYLIYFIIYIILLFVRLRILKKLTQFPIKMYVSKTLIKIILVSTTSIILPIFLKTMIGASHYRIIIIILASSLSIIISTYFIGLEPQERIIIRNKIHKKIASYKNI